ncbi:hypothetical protein [Flaviflagellibacter deserti]|uniref:Uncharacterized protein n=1 Tax=Flaviflagellibacter deserti TaxID=2267266 RepID=A0ABV9Z0Q2_9HYPH
MRKLLDGAEHFVVVDEGPGLSGSSFAAVGRLMRGRGVRADRITFMPGHGNGPGVEACEETRRIWAGTTVRPAVQIPDSRIADWIADLLGESLIGVEDLSAGHWRAKLFADPSQWPPIDPRTDRRKLLVRTATGAYFARFVGLGLSGERKLDRARRLEQAGFIPEVLGVVNGFLVQQWIEPAYSRPSDPMELGQYLRARLSLPAPGLAGASIDVLREMALANTAESLGEQAAGRLGRKLKGGEFLRQEIEPVAIDGACQPWKWFRNEQGRIFKADALDHDGDHDLVGPQPIVWDLVGACIELGYDRGAMENLNEIVLPGNLRPRLELFLFMEACYLAFRVGATRMAARALAGDLDERRRIESAEASYRKRLELLCFADE